MRTASRRIVRAGRDWIPLASFPLLAHAAEQSVLHQIDPQALPWFTWAWVLGLSIGGWFASSAPTLAGWIDNGQEAKEDKRALWTRRWGIVGRLAACLGAGFACFFSGLIVGTPMVVNFLAVLFASFGGDKYLQTRADKVSNRTLPGEQP